MFYAIYNSFGLNLSSDSIGWKIYSFDTKKERDEYLESNDYNGQNYVADKATVNYLRTTFGRERVNHYSANAKELMFGNVTVYQYKYL